MSSMIDTLAIAKQLQEAGDTPQHAEALANILGRTLQETTVTKHDLREAIAALDHKIDTVEQKLDSKLSRSILGLFAAQSAVIAIATSLVLAHIK